MTKYYCDICGCEVDKVEAFTLPVLGTKDAYDTHGNVLKRFFVYNPESVELCHHCKNGLGDLIRSLKGLPLKDLRKKITINVEYI